MSRFGSIDVTVHGTVQGVGFRLTTCRISRDFDVTGTVANQSDGTVRILAEGETSELEAFLDAVRKSRLGSLLTDMDISRGRSSNRWQGFEIQYS